MAMMSMIASSSTATASPESVFEKLILGGVGVSG